MLFRLFREQPTPELARSARTGSASAISPNERLQQLYHPWTSYVFVPLFALANAGHRDRRRLSLARAYTSPITLGILIGYVVGKPVGIIGTAWLVTRLSGGRLRPPVGWAAVAGGGAIAGHRLHGRACSIAALAFNGDQLEEAKLGVLTAALCASVATWLVFRADRAAARTASASGRSSASASRSSTSPIPSIRSAITSVGRSDAPVTLVEYGDFECPYCGMAEPVIRELLVDFGDDVRYVWRHLPLNDVHPQAQTGGRSRRGGGAAGRVLGDARSAARPPGRAPAART